MQEAAAHSDADANDRSLPGELIQCVGSAGLPPLLAGVFPTGVVGAELRQAADPALLLPEEAQCVSGAGPKRTQEFAAGRLCARRALLQLGFAHQALGVNHDRRPRWPALVVGSIAHSTGICAAVVAERRQFRAIGLDIEIVADVTQELWPYLFTPEETRWLAALQEPEQTRCAALLFSAKESFHKCQYGVTQQRLDFHDVDVDPVFGAANAGFFKLRPRRSIALLRHDALLPIGRFAFHANCIVTGMYLEAL